MNVLATPDAEALIREHAGRLFVWTDRQRCCGGATYLQTSFSPRRGRTYRHVAGGGHLDLYVDLGRLAPPEELHLAVRRLLRKRVEAYWNGCVFVG